MNFSLFTISIQKLTQNDAGRFSLHMGFCLSACPAHNIETVLIHMNERRLLYALNHCTCNRNHSATDIGVLAQISHPIQLRLDFHIIPQFVLSHSAIYI